jgi:hypothetical protein
VTVSRSTPWHQQSEKTDHRPKRDVSLAPSNAAMMPSAAQEVQPDTERIHAGKMAVGRGWNERP